MNISCLLLYLQESQERFNLQTKATVLSRKVWELLMLLPTNTDVLQERFNLQTKATVLSRKVWELLMLLPTNTDVLQGFRSITQDLVCIEFTTKWI